MSHGAPTKVGKRPGVAVEVTVELQIELVKKKKKVSGNKCFNISGCLMAQLTTRSSIS